MKQARLGKIVKFGDRQFQVPMLPLDTYILWKKHRAKRLPVARVRIPVEED